MRVTGKTKRATPFKEQRVNAVRMGWINQDTGLIRFPIVALTQSAQSELVEGGLAELIFAEAGLGICQLALDGDELLV